MHFFKLSDDAEVRVGDILKDKDSSAHFVYDLGDMWQFFISVDEVVPVEQSNGKVFFFFFFFFHNDSFLLISFFTKGHSPRRSW